MPLYLIESKPVLFIHVPKAGGTTIEFALEKHQVGLLDRTFRHGYFSCSPQHFHAEMLKSALDLSAMSYTFMTVRHPVARLKSEYFWRRRFSNLEQDFEPWAFSCFSQFKKNPFFGDNHFRPMVDFKCEGAEFFKVEDGVDKVLNGLNNRFPALALSTVADRHMSSQSTAEAPISAELDALVSEIYKSDFTTFGY